MSEPRRGWTVFTEQGAAEVLEDMRHRNIELHDVTVRFLIELGRTAGLNVEAGLNPPGSPMDDLGIRYGTSVPGEAVIVEYVLLHDIREVRVPTLVWIA